MKSETKWAVVRVAGPTRQHLVGPVERTRRAAWQACLDMYGKTWRDSPAGDVSKRAGYNLFHEQAKAGQLRAVKVTISWENV